MRRPRTLSLAFADARASRDSTRELRAASREICVQALRAMERELVEVLDGDGLRGAQRLALNLHGSFVRPPGGPPEALVLTKHGTLAMVERSTIRRFETAKSRPATDDDLMVEDVELVAKAITEALQRHIVAVERSGDRFVRAATIAQRLEEALAEAG